MSGITLHNTGLVSAKLLRVSKEMLSRKTGFKKCYNQHILLL